MTRYTRQAGQHPAAGPGDSPFRLEVTCAIAHSRRQVPWLSMEG